jgi:hypothetical protein
MPRHPVGSPEYMVAVSMWHELVFCLNPNILLTDTVDLSFLCSRALEYGVRRVEIRGWWRRLTLLAFDASRNPETDPEA